jgi:hypothetical protein
VLRFHESPASPQIPDVQSADYIDRRHRNRSEGATTLSNPTSARTVRLLQVLDDRRRGLGRGFLRTSGPAIESTARTACL